MKGLRIATLAMGAFLLTSSSPQTSQAADKAESLVGVWVCVKCEEVPAGAKATLEFAKDGKCKHTLETKAASITLNGRYKVDGEKLEIDLDLEKAGVEQHYEYTITKASKTTLILYLKKNKKEEEYLRKEE